ncbi:hypothetical protein BDV96DRAFT_374523 [Lophiotrema nucula]|uniref:Uncharacterized protein n=1 Tax=Lophiotrema nucula TaxID=690887 RepID=A0A6A5YH10_9PLEO|nr:hypothetical protein BDV96DRAFT_374523 [Lophiotrema nucula]
MATPMFTSLQAELRLQISPYAHLTVIVGSTMELTSWTCSSSHYFLIPRPSTSISFLGKTPVSRNLMMQKLLKILSTLYWKTVSSLPNRGHHSLRMAPSRYSMACVARLFFNEVELRVGTGHLGSRAAGVQQRACQRQFGTVDRHSHQAK